MLSYYMFTFKSIAKYIALMKTEMRKKEPDRTVLRDAMKRTTAYRQNYYTLQQKF